MWATVCVLGREQASGRAAKAAKGQGYMFRV